MVTTRFCAQAATGLWWLFLVTGILWMLIALVVLRFNVTSIAAVGALMGAVFLIAGVNEFMALGTTEGWKAPRPAGHPVSAARSGPSSTRSAPSTSLAALLGFLLLFKGVFDISAVVTKPVNELWWLGLVVGILEILLAFWASPVLRAAGGAHPDLGRLLRHVPRHRRDRARLPLAECGQGARGRVTHGSPMETAAR